jgi:Fe-S cluster assembly scaffold protein SufB
MTRKDFELIAKAISNLRYDCPSINPEVIDIFSDYLSEAIAAEHPRFDRYTFAVATGVYQVEVIDGVKRIYSGENRKRLATHWDA